ncbi:hypothetical protein OIU84_018815 [Salix udensis]|uniref:Phytocyanin domain-containing protein n=1 Tax=Salix udensis TaxID=889485 RepID=A0AAD6KZQ4_9ROSI|nr:hypothetical protein OIU84_018815 [Salix udensis]
MALVKRAVALLTAMTLMLELIHAAVYKVGDSAGWTTSGNVDYKQWSATKTFQVGDVISGCSCGKLAHELGLIF